MSLSGKIVLITGASSGIGKATACLMAKMGARLSLTGRNVENLGEISKKCRTLSNSEPLIISAELSKEGDVKNIIDETIERYGGLDILVNNAGVLESGSIENTSLEQYDRIFAINVRAVYQLTVLATPHLIKSKGSIVNVSSVNGIRSFAGVLAYNMSKAALDQMTRCVALELAGKGVRVNSVNPGVTKTEIHKRAGMDEETYATFLERSKETHALGRWGEPEEVAEAIVFLAGNQSSFITGATLPVDGGRHAMCPR